MVNTSHTTVRVGENDVIIECIVLRGNPTRYSYRIVHNDSVISSNSILILTNIQVADLGTYRCDVTNDAGTGSASVTIDQEGR